MKSTQKRPTAGPVPLDAPKTLTVASDAFLHGEAVPERYSCDGADISPPLAWEGAPSRTRAYALLVEDPDAPRGTFTHWLAWNLPPDMTRLEEGADLQELGARVGTNDFGDEGYGGPCPPGGTHRYFFRLLALDDALALPRGSTAPELREALRGHVLAWGELMGTYTRRR